MNHATRFTKLALLLIVAGALALAGCGGDDGVDESVHAQTMQELDAERQRADDAEARADDAEAAAEDATERADDAEAAVEDATERADDAEATAEDATERADDAETDRMAAEAAAAKALMDVQMAADTAAMAAKTASDAAAMAATAAMTATANIATLQTGEMSKMMAYDAKKAADGAMKAYMAAKTASETANADDATIETATTARDMAVAAKMDAEKYAMTADEESKGAVKYAMTELMIDSTMKSVGESSIDARMGMLTDTADDGSKMITGLLDGEQPMRTTAMRLGQVFAQRDEDGTPPTTVDTPYKQAVDEGMITIGKTLDTTDDMARLTLITSYEGDKKVRVFADGPVAEVANVVGAATAGDSTADPVVPETGGALAVGATVKAVGLYYKANPAADGGTADALDATDLVAVTGAKGEEIFALSSSDGEATEHARRIDSTTNAGTGVTTHTYRVVDILANASATDGPDEDGAAEDLAVTVNIPAVVGYEHLHFGVWAGLGEAEKDGSQMLADLGIGFVQNFSDSGITEKQGIGSATFNGDWVAAVQRAHGEGEGAITLADGKATLTANFGTDKFMSTLSGLATLEGSLSGNGFSGMKATADANNAYGLTVGAAFTGMFEGGIYGSDGAEAGGVFDFSSDSDGAFRGAFGGHRDGSP